MLQRSIAISLGTTALVGAGGLIGSYLTGGFTDTYPMKRVIWKDKPTSVPETYPSGYINDTVASQRWAKKELEFTMRTIGKDNHPWWTELLSVRGNDKLNIPVLIAKWCMNNNDTTVDVTSVKGQMLEKLCDVSFS